MNRIKATVLLLTMSTLCLTGCADVKEKLPFLQSKEEESTEAVITPEMQALIGTYTEEGQIIVGYDENGWMITEEGDPNVVTENTLGVGYEDFLSNPAYYDSVVIVTRNGLDEVVNTVHYQLDYNNRIGKKDWFTSGKNIGTTYYNNQNSKAYTNVGMTKWEEQNNERVENIMMIFENQYFSLSEYNTDGLYVYVKGALQKEAAGSNVILMNEIYKQIPTVTDMEMFNIYNVDDHRLVRSEIKVSCPQGTFTVSAVPETTGKFLKIPDYVMSPATAPTQSIVEGIENIPVRAYLYSALYSTDKPETITEDYLIEEYTFKKSELEPKYPGIDVNVFLQQFAQIDDEMAVDEFLLSYEALGGVYETPEQNAIYDIIYDRLEERDDSLTQELIDTMVLKPEVVEEEVPEESAEEVPEESTEEVVEEVPEEPQYITMYVTGTTVNKRKGPGTSFDKDGQVHQGDKVLVVGPAEGASDWSECVDENGNTFYIKSSFLKE